MHEYVENIESIRSGQYIPARVWTLWLLPEMKSQLFKPLEITLLAAILALFLL
jgi:hypothetical protein